MEAGLALAATDHPHHRQALHYWEQQAAAEVLFCTVTAVGLIRLVSQTKLMGTAVLASVEASALLQGFCRQPGVAMAAAEHDGWEPFHSLLSSTELPAGALRSRFRTLQRPEMAATLTSDEQIGG
uniref:hypothetical protein n=1 Tax=Cyanobium sp. TaxID=2164130 RepID=UPI004047DB92